MSEEIETGVSHIAYFRTDGGSPKLYTQEYVDDLQNQLQQKENIIKEVREYIEENKKGTDCCGETYIGLGEEEINDILEILDKEKDI